MSFLNEELIGFTKDCIYYPDETKHIEYSTLNGEYHSITDEYRIEIRLAFFTCRIENKTIYKIIATDTLLCLTHRGFIIYLKNIIIPMQKHKKLNCFL